MFGIYKYIYNHVNHQRVPASDRADGMRPPLPGCERLGSPRVGLCWVSVSIYVNHKRVPASDRADGMRPPLPGCERLGSPRVGLCWVSVSIYVYHKRVPASDRADGMRPPLPGCERLGAGLCWVSANIHHLITTGSYTFFITLLELSHFDNSFLT